MNVPETKRHSLFLIFPACWSLSYWVTKIKPNITFNVNKLSAYENGCGFLANDYEEENGKKEMW